jgi:hypothetical protein
MLQTGSARDSNVEKQMKREKEKHSSPLQCYITLTLASHNRGNEMPSSLRWIKWLVL